MTETTTRVVDQYSFDRARQVITSASEIMSALPNSNSADVQAATNYLVKDMVMYAQELLKTPPIPVDPPLLRSADAAE